ncbi:MAG: hypothetical protein ACTSRK_12410, partial [Promethearchaeota archaeon]
MVSVRMDMDIRLLLDELGNKLNLKRSDVSRAYLNLCQTVVVKTNQTIYLTDDTEVGFIPMRFFREVNSEISIEKQFELGDQLGTLARQNCQLMSLPHWQDKIAYVQRLGWFKIQLIHEEDEDEAMWLYHAIYTHDLSLNILHALLYRLLEGTKFPMSLTAEYLRENFKDKFKKAKRKSPDGDWKSFKDKLGGHEDNFGDSNSIFKFDVLREEVVYE